MSYEKIFGCSKKIESILSKKYGAKGKGLHTLVSSVESDLPENIVKYCRFIATIRNKMAHNDDFEFDNKTEEQFTKRCDEINTYLEKENTEFSIKYIGYSLLFLIILVGILNWIY